MPDSNSPSVPEIAPSRRVPDGNPVPGMAPHSSRHLLRSTIIAAVVAAVLLVTVVMPAEYGVDPTGAGRLLGLTSMGEIKVALEKEASAGAQAREAGPTPQAAPPAMIAGPKTETAVPEVVSTAAPDPAVVEAGTVDALVNTHVTEIVLAPNEGKEIKLVMRKDARVTYSWATDRGVVNYDLHADAPGINYHGYGKGSGKKSAEGVLVAAFDGAHGWFWRNRGSENVTVTLTTNGEYLELKRL